MSDSSITLSWGLQPPPEATIAWGARAIWQNGYIDLLWDRQDCKGGTKAERKAFIEEVNGNLDIVRQRAEEAYKQGDLRGDQENRITLVDSELEGGGSGVFAEADTRASYGYLYLVIYRVPTPTDAD